MGFPLIFAVRFLRANQNALWAIVEDNRSNTFLNVTYQGVIDGVRNVLWNEFTLMLNPNLIIKCEFSKKSKINSITHLKYGRQISATFTDGENTLKQNEDAFMTCGLLETYHLEEFKIEIIDDDITIQYLKPKILVSFLADLIYKMNNLIVDEFGNVVYDASKLVVRSDTEAHNSLIDRNLIEVLAKPLMDNKLMFLGSIGDLGFQLNKWKEYGGK